MMAFGVNARSYFDDRRFTPDLESLIAREGRRVQTILHRLSG